MVSVESCITQPSPPAPLPKVEGSSESLLPLGEDLGEGSTGIGSSPLGRSGDEGGIHRRSGDEGGIHRRSGDEGSIYDGIPEELAARAAIRRSILEKNQNDELEMLNAEKNNSELIPHNSSFSSHFPASFKFTDEMGWIPEGWEVKKSGSLFDVRDGTHDSPKQSAAGKYLITSRHITGNTIDYSNAYLISEEDFEQVNRRSKVDSYDILLTMIGTVGIPFLVMEEEINFAIKNVGLFKSGVNRTLATYFFTYLKSDFMIAFMESRLAGTTQKYLTLKILRELPTTVPHSDIMKGFGNQTLPIFEKIHSNNNATDSLAALRDTLLPKLISGELRIPDAEKLAEKVL